MRIFRSEADTVALHAPTIGFTKGMTLWQGARRIDLHYLGRGHTASDVVVHLPGERLIASGDLVISPVPFVGSTSHPREFDETLERLLALRHVAIVPGHGEVLRSDSQVVQTIAMLRSLVEQVDAVRGAGDSLVVARRRVELSSFRRHFVGADPVRGMLFDAYVVSSGVPAAFRAGIARGAP